MRVVIVWTLSLGSLTGCLQPTTPAQSTKAISTASRTAATPATVTQPKLRLSVQMNPRHATAGGIITVAMVFSASGSEPVVLEPVGEGFVLRLDRVDGERVFELREGIVATISPGQPRIVKLELPAYRQGAGGEIVPYEPGKYQLTMAMTDRPEKSLPCYFQIVEARDSSEPASTL